MTPVIIAALFVLFFSTACYLEVRILNKERDYYAELCEEQRKHIQWLKRGLPNGKTWRWEEKE